MKNSCYKSATSVTVNEEAYQDSNTFWSEYWYYFPRIAINPSSLFESAILAIIILFITIFYTIVYVIYMSLIMLVRSIRR